MEAKQEPNDRPLLSPLSGTMIEAASRAVVVLHICVCSHTRVFFHMCVLNCVPSHVRSFMSALTRVLTHMCSRVFTHIILVPSLLTHLCLIYNVCSHARSLIFGLKCFVLCSMQPRGAPSPLTPQIIRLTMDMPRFTR